LLQAMVENEKVAAYFDISFQHASAKVLRSMRRFGDKDSFLHLINQVRALSPQAGIRSNFIVGFPGETEEDFNQVMEFVDAAKLDAVGVFGYSDEDGTEAASATNKLADEVIAERVAKLTQLAESAVANRAAARIGEQVLVLIDDEELQEGRAAHQGPEVDGTVAFMNSNYRNGEWVSATVIDSMGSDLVAK
ncbi:MAG: hypothetical protein RL301_347, partial [Actinomycetota bacterium]